ncbi:MAG: glycosyl hydrolase family 18 protein [Defluviitaleaceae bacterium]|nr:glycosyl hydrolase family 18 protein [Defluviitaleaceae bacterium]
MKSQKMVVTLIATILLIVGAVVLVVQVIVPRVGEFSALAGIRANTNVVDFHTQFGLDSDVTQLIFDGQWIRDTVPPLVDILGGEPHVYLHADFLRDFIDPFVFWDNGARVLFVSTLYEMLEFAPRREYVLVNGSQRPIDDAVLMRDGDVFVPVSVVEGLYALNVEFHDEYNIVVVTSLYEPMTTASVRTGSADVRYWPSSRSPIATRISQGEEVVLFFDMNEEDYIGDETDNFVRVRTPQGLLGYILITSLEDMNTDVMTAGWRNLILDGFIDNTVHHSRVWQGDENINLIWELIYLADANRAAMETPLHNSVNVVSPTWFRIAPEGTHLNSVAIREYVDWVHEQGALVWPLVFDVWYTQSRAMLTDRNARRMAIEQLIEAVDLLNLDGLNIDFEHLTAAEGPYKIQFLRELAIPMRQRGAVLSAAVKVPIPATAFYRRDLIGKTVDFVMVMTYDEHWATSPVAGPNASLPFVRRGVSNMLLEVPAERLIMGLPFYNRIWREVVSTGEVSHYRALGTNTTRRFFEERGVVWTWDFEIGSYFGEVAAFEDGETVVFRVWLECGRSIGEKMHIFYDNNLAGVASWSRLHAIDEFWEAIGRYF